MKNARQQAESYVFLLDANHPAPPFIVVCDVGHCLELYADFTGTGRAYGHFPDRNGFRIYMEDLRKEEVRVLLKRIWLEPHSLDPSKEAARVTRDIARRLAQVSKALEERGCDPEDVAHFLMRCLFTMFAEDVGLLPPDSLRGLLEKSVKDPSHFPHRLKALWQEMEKGETYSHVIEARVRHFNGGLFKDTTVFDLDREEIGELLAAARYSWTEVDPAIFGTLLEQALDKTERKKLGAHYTPRAYVQRLVEATVMEPLREDWQKVMRKAEHAKDTGDEKAAVAIVRNFHRQLCTTRVLDPACGTGNFLYVSLELMKKLEGEVLETLAQLGEPESMGLERETVDPHQLLGLELNPRAAAIAELVVWIGYLQQHYRTRNGHPSEPILRAFENINFGKRLGYDAVLTWDGYPSPQVVEKDGKLVETYPNARRPVWPEAEFIVGNPPFLGKGAAMRGPLGDAYVDALWTAHPQMNESADFVLYWWDKAAEMLTQKNATLRRFGLVTTNSISQTFNRRVLERHLGEESQISLAFAIPDHPWTKSTKDAAAVRIAMTVASSASSQGSLYEVVSERGLETDEPHLTFSVRHGKINPDLTVGAEVSRARPLQATEGLSWNGVMLAGKGFVLSDTERAHICATDNGKSTQFIKRFINGSDLVGTAKRCYIIDFFGIDDSHARSNAPSAYQHVLSTVKPERDKSRDTMFRERWWLFGRPRPDLRKALSGIERYIGTTETSKHRLFQFIDKKVVPDHMVIAIASDDALMLGYLSSRQHICWALRAGGWLGIGNDPRYSKSRCFDPFPFPDPSESLKSQIRVVAEELDAFRKVHQAEHPKLTLTQMYNVLEKLKANAPLSADDKRIKDEGLILILKELHEKLDALVFQAYGWPDGLTDEEILERLVALNAERAKEEAAGHVRWLRPDYQIPRFAKGLAATKTGELDLGDNVVSIDKGLPDFPRDRTEDSLAVEHALLQAGRPMDATELARGFKRGGKRIEFRVAQALTTLVRYGHITDMKDGRYLARKAA